jgi:hypothetical protein
MYACVYVYPPPTADCGETTASPALRAKIHRLTQLDLRRAPSCVVEAQRNGGRLAMRYARPGSCPARKAPRLARMPPRRCAAAASADPAADHKPRRRPRRRRRTALPDLPRPHMAAAAAMPMPGSAGRGGRWASISLGQNRRHTGESQSERPRQARMQRRPPHQDAVPALRCVAPERGRGADGGERRHGSLAHHANPDGHAGRPEPALLGSLGAACAHAAAIRRACQWCAQRGLGVGWAGRVRQLGGRRPLDHFVSWAGDDRWTTSLVGRGDDRWAHGGALSPATMRCSSSAQRGSATSRRALRSTAAASDATVTSSCSRSRRCGTPSPCRGASSASQAARAGAAPRRTCPKRLLIEARCGVKPAGIRW